MARWPVGDRTMSFLIERGRLEPIRAVDPAVAASAALDRATRRLGTRSCGPRSR